MTKHKQFGDLHISIDNEDIAGEELACVLMAFSSGGLELEPTLSTQIELNLSGEDWIEFGKMLVELGKYIKQEDKKRADRCGVE